MHPSELSNYPIILQAWKQLSRCQRNVLYTLFLIVGLIALYYIYIVNPGLAGDGGGGRGRVNPVIAAGLNKARNKIEKVHEVSIDQCIYMYISMYIDRYVSIYIICMYICTRNINNHPGSLSGPKTMYICIYICS